MIEKIKEAIKQQNENLIVVNIASYKDGKYIVEAVERLDEPSINDPYYIYDSVNGRVESFAVMRNLNGFLTTMNKRKVYSYGE